MQFIKEFKDLSSKDVEIAGGKGASLGEMTLAGIPVPNGFVVLSGAFEKFIDEAKLNIEIDAILDTVDTEQIHTIENASEQIQSLILNSEIPAGIEKEIYSEFKKLGADFVAVRSSATSEDSADAAWAGQLDSFLNTTKETLIENVRKCWASLFTPRAIFYRFEKKLHKEKVSVAVVVQKMINSEESGIAFSVHPVTEDYNQLIIEAGYGLGESIVSGQITPDSYVTDKQDMHIIDISVNEQPKGLYRKSDGGNEWKELEGKGKEQVLTEKEIIELSKIIINIENHYDFPVDVEWAREKGKFHIVQSRPITTLSKKVKTKGDSIEERIKQILEKTKGKWEKYWSVKFSFIAATMLAKYYIQDLSKIHGVGFEKVVIVNRKGHSSSFLEIKDRKNFAENLIEKYLKNQPIENIAEVIKEKADQLNKVSNKKPEIKNLPAFLRLFAEYAGAYHIIPRHIIDFANPEEVEKIKDVLKDVRLHTEQIPINAHNYLINCLKKIKGYDILDLEFLTIEELEKYIEDKVLPSKEELESRKNIVGAVCTKKLGFNLIKDGSFVNWLNELNVVSKDTNELKGTVVAGSGVVKGRVRIIDDPKNYKDFNKNDILVTGMTRPEFMPLIKKSSAIITDAGGLLCHAAIVSRELGVPCIIGTQCATVVLNDGDMVEVDADKGIVRILK